MIGSDAPTGSSEALNSALVDKTIITMHIHSLKLTIQDMPDKKGKPFASVFGTLILNTGEVKVDKDDMPVKDAEGDFIPILDNINFILPLNASKELTMVVQSLAVEALTLKDMQIAKKNGQLSHYVEAIKGLDPRKKQATKKAAKSVPPTPRRRTTKPKAKKKK